MSMSIVTNVNSLIAQENLRVNNEFQGRTIQRLTSGFRINASGDDAAGLAVANLFRSNVAELQQGVRNANDGLSVLQIIDGGLNNISKMLDRLKTLATQSASTTFTGDRTTLNSEYTTLLTEIDRQAANIGLVSGGKNNQLINVYIGGGENLTTSSVNIDLQGTSARVDASNLGIGSTNILGGTLGSTLSGAAIDLRSGSYLGSTSQSFTFRTGTGDKVVTIGGTGTALSGQQAVDALNAGLSGTGISANINSSSGQLEFFSNVAYSVTTTAPGSGQIANSGTAINNSMYSVAGTGFADVTGPQTLQFVQNGVTKDVVLGNNIDTVAQAVAAINQSLQAQGMTGVTAVADAAGTSISFQSASNFTVAITVAGTGGLTSVAASTTLPTEGASQTQSALTAVDKITNAVQQLGRVAGKVGTGQNQLQYAIQLAQSQISSFSAAESRIRDADIASEAANLTKAQVMQQSSLAAMAQANAAPQAVLALLRG